MKISMKGYGENAATFKTQGLVCAAHAVTMAENLTVKPCEENDTFIGFAVNVRGEYACVQLSGYAEFDYTGTAPSVGYCTLAADGNGGVSVAESGKSYLVVNVDSVNSKVGIIL